MRLLIVFLFLLISGYRKDQEILPSKERSFPAYPVIKYIIALLLLVSISSIMAQAQYHVRFVVKENTVTHHDSIYITGTFNQWDSLANPKYLMKPTAINEKSIVLNLPAGTIQYKFHRGNWLTVEKQYNGDEIPNRVITINKDTSVTNNIISWRDRLIADKMIELARQKSDTTRLRIIDGLVKCYVFPDFYNSDSAFYYAQEAIQILQHILASNNYKSGTKEGYASQVIGLQGIIASQLHALGNYFKALEIRLENIKLAEKIKDKYILVGTLYDISNEYYSIKDYRNVLKYGKLMADIVDNQSVSDVRYPTSKWFANEIIAKAYYKMELQDSALFYVKNMEVSEVKSLWPGYMLNKNILLGDIYSEMANNSSAFYYYRQVLHDAPQLYASFAIAQAQAGMARLFQKENRLDSALYYARRSLKFFQNSKIAVQVWGENSNSYIAEISPLIAELYRKNNRLDSAYKYLNLSVTLKDSLYNLDKIRQFQTLTFNETARRQQLEQQSRIAVQQYKTKIKMFILIAVMAGILIFALVLFRNNRQKQKANHLLQIQKKEIETTLSELKNTQSQLIQSEKMASLGELTAGIAHEIQNPLNFVNNFSEVNKELLAEMNEEIEKGNLAELKTLVNNVMENEEKIGYHGKRADTIVKGMLQHTRNSSGVKEPTNINTLANDYLQLAYHGLRAKDKSFNATINTDFDESIGKINVIRQDIGRVILNLITNAFYAVSEKKNQQMDDYEPTISVSTKRTGDKVLISVIDNGNGIPDKVLDKIFLPFFTTKPAGQGTGLGLSMSYDLVKAHGGELKVETKEGEGARFTIELINDKTHIAV
jgi:signal transduction histidine kinase